MHYDSRLVETTNDLKHDDVTFAQVSCHIVVLIILRLIVHPHIFDGNVTEMSLQ